MVAQIELSRGQTKLVEQPRQMCGLVVRIQSARVRQHPETRVCELLRLKAESGLRTVECGSIGCQTDDGRESRLVTPYLALEAFRTTFQFVAGQLVRRRGRTIDQIGDA